MATLPPDPLEFARSLLPQFTQFRDACILAGINSVVPIPPAPPFRIKQHLPANFKGLVLAHFMLWYFAGGLKGDVKDKSAITGYTSSDPARVQQQMMELQAINIDGALCNWRGPSNALETASFAEILKQFGANGMWAGLVIDKDTVHGTTKGAQATQVFITAVRFVLAQWWNKPGFYQKYILEFGCIDNGVDFAVVQATFPELKFLHGGNNTAPPPGQKKFTWFEHGDTAMLPVKYQSQQYKIGSLFYQFNDTDPFTPTVGAWGGAPRNYTPWLLSSPWFRCLQAFSTAYMTGTVEDLQVLTWNDYKEHSMLEPIVELALG